MTHPFRWWRPLAGLAVAVLFVALLARRVEWDQVRRVLAGATWPALLVGLLALVADMGARITRWWWMLRALQPDLSWASCARPFLGSLALNNTVPLRAGDVLRVFGFQRSLRAPSAHIAGTLVLERMLDLLVLLVILFLSVLGISGVFPQSFLALAYTAGMVCLAGLLAISLFPDRITRLIQSLVGRLFGGHRWTQSLNRFLGQLTESLALLRSPGRAMRILGTSAVAWVLEGAVFACAVWSLHIEVPWPAPWLALSAATLATLLPSSPGYVGTFDYFASIGLVAYGANHSAAAAFAFVVHLLLWVPVTAAGFAALLWARRSSIPLGLSAPSAADRSR